MSNIRVNVPSTIHSGSELIFLSPCDSSQVSGLKVYYPNEEGENTSQSFIFKDAQGYDLSDIDNLFTANVLVKVILNTVEGDAYIQNAVTNKYLENRFKELEENSKITASDGSTYMWGVDDKGVYLECITSDSGGNDDQPEDIQALGMLKLSDEDTGYYIDIDGNTYNVDMMEIEDDKMKEGSYDLDLV